MVHGPPVHRMFGQLIANDELVFGRAPGELTRVHHQGSIIGQQTFAALNCVFDEGLSGEVAKRTANVVDAKLRELPVDGPTPKIFGIFSRHLVLS